MKNSCLSILLSFSLLAVSCHHGDWENGRVSVRFDVALSDADTKAIADGQSATQLLVGVWDADGTPLDGYKQVVTRFPGQHFSFELQLLESMEYKILLFAQSADYYISAGDYMASGTSSSILRAVPLRSSHAMDTDAPDAFAAVKAVTSSELSQSITLGRICAQVNIASSADIAGISGASLSVTGMPTHYNVFTGMAAGSASVEIPSAAPLANQTFTEAGQNYHYIGYAFIPVGSGEIRTSANLTLTRSGSSSVKALTDVPLCGNYRTNILGEF